MTRDIVVTWPKTRPLGSYLAELELARARGLTVSFRVPSRPSINELTSVRCYRVHDGEVRGYLRVLAISWQNSEEVRRVASDARPGKFWPAGIYIACDPEWHPLKPAVPMRGFQGWRWFERPTC